MKKLKITLGAWSDIGFKPTMLYDIDHLTDSEIQDLMNGIGDEFYDAAREFIEQEIDYSWELVDDEER